MALNLNQWYTLQFPTFGNYKLLVMVEDDEAIPDGTWLYVMETVKDGQHFKSMVQSTDTGGTTSSYALTSEGAFCETGPNPGEGMANLFQTEFSSIAYSSEIQIVDPDQWLNRVGNKYLLELYFWMGNTALAPCDNATGEPPTSIANPPTPLNGGPASFYFPVPPGTPPDKKKMEKKKVRIIWTNPI